MYSQLSPVIVVVVVVHHLWFDLRLSDTQLDLLSGVTGRVSAEEV